MQEPVNNRMSNLEYIINDYKLDLFMVCELNNQTGASDILNILQQRINPNYAMANFVLNTSDDNFGGQNDLQNLIYYDSSKFILESQTEITTIYRDFNRYTLKFNTTDMSTNPIYLEVFVCHLKAYSGIDNEDLRNALYYFSNHLPVTLQLQTNQTLKTPEFASQSGIVFSNGNIVVNTINLKVNFDVINNQYLNIYNTLVQKIKTIAINNSTLISEDISTLSSGVYYILVDDKSINPLKFIKSN